MDFSAAQRAGRLRPVGAPLAQKAHAYVFEFKRDKPAGEALAQIRAKGYADRFAAATKRPHPVGVSFSTSRRQIGEWREEMVAALR